MDKIIKLKKKEYSFITKLFILSFFLLICFIIYKLINILVILLIALFLNILFSPLLNKFNKWKIKDLFGITFIYILLILAILIVIFAVLPIFIEQLSKFLDIMYNGINYYLDIYNDKGIDGFNIPNYLKDILLSVNIDQILNSAKENLGQISFFITNNLKNFLISGAGLISGITNFITNFVLLFIFTFFIALERKDIRRFFYEIIPNEVSRYLIKKESKIISTLSNWIKSQLILGFAIFVITLIGLLILRIFGIKIEEFFILSLIAGMMEFIPYIGPFIALIPALAIGLGIGFKATFVIFILYIIIQQIENNLLVPYIMGKNLSISSFSVLIAMVIGATLFGIIGIILSVPIVAILQIFISDYIKYKK